jgi:aryl-alcohol dehydrogenase-like predicted oxidoreductase
MAMSGVYGTTDAAQSVAVIHAAIERGVTLLDTGDFYARSAGFSASSRSSCRRSACARSSSLTKRSRRGR